MEREGDSTLGALSFQQGNQSAEDLSIFNVFSNELLRDKIFLFAVRNLNGTGADRVTVRSIRAVGKDWNDSLVKLLHRKELPFLEITLLMEDYEENVRILTSFTETFSKSVNILGAAPTFEVSLLPHFFREQIRPSFCKFLLTCGQGIYRINLVFPNDGGSMIGPIPNLSLPSLKHVSVEFEDEDINERVQSPSENVASLVQSIFNGATSLKTLDFQERYPRLRIYDKILLPSTITVLCPPRDATNEELEIMLLKNHFPNLAFLSFTIPHKPAKEGLLTTILEKYRKSLQVLLLTFEPTEKGVICTFRFPVMENLQIFDVTHCRQLTLELDPLAGNLPSLRELNVTTETANILQSITSRSRFCSMSHLNLGRMFAVDSSLLTLFGKSFPNLVKLEIDLLQLSGLQCIFKELRNLVDLQLHVVDPERIPNSDTWDSLLIGIPVESLEELRDAQKDLDLPDIAGYPSIRNLKDLRLLALSRGFFHGRGCPTFPLISDLAFHFAFLRMPLLKELRFSWRFPVSAEMTEIWSQEGRLLNHS